MDIKDMSCFFTGHRVIPREEYNTIKEKLYNIVTKLIENYGVKNFCAGGALGFDTLAAQVVLDLKKKYDIRLILFLPCRNQTEKWRKSDVLVYNKIMSQCDMYYVFSEEYTKDCMLLRNRRMAEACTYGISYLRRKTGGTAYTVNYAKQIGVNIVNI